MSETAFEKKVQEQTAATAFQLVWGWVEKLGGWAKDKHKVQQATKTYAESYRARHGAVHTLGMSKPIPLHEIYTAVRVVPSDYLNRFVQLEKMEEEFVASGRFHGAFHDERTEDGVAVANRLQFLNLLGAPGSGKSTFLRRLGQEALLARKSGERIDPADAGLDSHYEHALLPVYLELKEFRTKSVDLIARIGDEFAISGFPESKAFVEAALAGGKLLVLLDGLDEVPDEKQDEVIGHTCDFVDRYAPAGNRFVTSCRTAHYQNSFRRFTNVVIADFGNEQVERFARNWFRGFRDNQAGTAEAFVKALRANPSALELARTPLLLTFLCITFANDNNLPRHRAQLYRRALDLLLREWAASKLVHDEPVYSELHADLELDMLAGFAEGLFRKNQFFFTRAEVTGHIRTYMSQVLNAPKTLDAGKILEAIEVQQGLIVRRAQDTYSFSHLTIQEYLTAERVWADELTWKQVVQNNMFGRDQRWWVVFELMAGMKGSDDLMRAMGERARREFDHIIDHNESFRSMLEWVARMANRPPAIPAPRAAVGRLVLLALAATLARGSAFARPRGFGHDQSLESTLQLARALDKSLLSYFRSGSTGAFAMDPDDKDRKLAVELIRCCLQMNLIGGRLGAFDHARSLLENKTASLDEVARELDLPMTPSFDPVPEPLLDYFQGCELMVQCQNARYRRSDETWDEVCDTILRLPAAS